MVTRVVDPELPWGCWLRIEKDRSGTLSYVDEATGESWPSVRHALWMGRLGMPIARDQPDAAMLELLHAKLAAVARRAPEHHADAVDLFSSEGYANWFHHWLIRERLIVASPQNWDKRLLTNEGWAVLHMLAATRPADVRQARPSAASVRSLVELGLGPEDREVRLARMEAAASQWDASFLRRDLAGKATIIMSRRGDGPMPSLHTVWVLSFIDQDRRDAFYDWLCARLDRWTAWGELAGRHGSERLTHHLLEVLAASLEDFPQMPVVAAGEATALT